MSVSVKRGKEMLVVEGEIYSRGVQGHFSHGQKWPNIF